MPDATSVDNNPSRYSDFLMRRAPKIDRCSPSAEAASRETRMALRNRHPNPYSECGIDDSSLGCPARRAASRDHGGFLYDTLNGYQCLQAADGSHAMSPPHWNATPDATPDSQRELLPGPSALFAARRGRLEDGHRYLVHRYTRAQTVGSDVPPHCHTSSSIDTLAPTAPDGSEWELVDEAAFAVDSLVVSDAANERHHHRHDSGITLMPTSADKYGDGQHSAGLLSRIYVQEGDVLFGSGMAFNDPHRSHRRLCGVEAVAGSVLELSVKHHRRGV